MAPKTPIMTPAQYEQAARDYLAALPLEHFMEATQQSVQREITQESFALLRHRRPAIRYFGELLLQYHHEGRLRQVVPDWFALESVEEQPPRTCFNLEHETVPPFWVHEYVSESNARKDYEDGFRKYERELKVPYLLRFRPERQELEVFSHDGTHYVRLEPDGRGRVAVPEWELEVALLHGWVRYWLRGELLSLPAELAERMDALAERVRQLEDRVTRQTTALQDKDRALQDKDRQLAEGLARLRKQIEKRARRAGRQDILDQLAATADANQLDRWLDELDGGP